MILLILAQNADEAARALRLSNAWVALLIAGLLALGALVIAARALRPGRHSARRRPRGGEAAVVDPWEEAGRRLRLDEGDDGTVRHDGVRNP